MKKRLSKITIMFIAIIIGAAASYLLVIKGIKWPAGVIGFATITGMLILPRFGNCCHRNNPIFWYLPHNRYHR
ncbi:MAG: hypothetical protein WCK54_17415 [Desulfuromonadales bacterium]